MGWDKGKYYTRSRRVNGRVVREYVGQGPMAEAVARLDETVRRRRAERRAARDRAFDVAGAGAMVLAGAWSDAMVYAKALLVSEGFWRPRGRGWRRRRP